MSGGTLNNSMEDVVEHLVQTLSESKKNNLAVS